MNNKSSLSSRRQYLGMLLPAMIFICVLSVVPIIGLFFTSFMELTLTRMDQAHFNGIDNFIRMFQDSRFLGSLQRQAVMSVMSVTLQLCIGLLFALVLSVFHGRMRILRSMIIIPFVIPPVVVGLIWLTIFTPSISPINAFIELFGAKGPSWLTTNWLAMLSIIIADTWNNFPFCSIVLLTALQNIPSEIFESVQLDGATTLQKLRYITLPLIKPSIVLCITLRLIESLKAFPLIFIMTMGGPGVSTEVTNFYAYLQAFQYNHIGYASAMGLFIFLVTIVLSVFITRFNSSVNSYD